MEYHFQLHEEVPTALHRIALKQVELAIHEAHDESMDRHEAIHRIRKRCKKQRALLRLVRGSLKDRFEEENAFYRDLSRRLSSLRDAQALLEAFDRTVERFPEEAAGDCFQSIRDLLETQRRDETGGEQDLVALSNSISQELEAAAERIPQWELEVEGFDAISGGLVRTYRRARRGLERAANDPTEEVLHEWRKRVKYHWYHTRLLRKFSSRLLRPHRQIGKELGTTLGQDHDLAVLRSKLGEASSSLDAKVLDRYLTLTKMYQKELQAKSIEQGQHLLAEEPSRLAARWRAYWEASVVSQDELKGA